MNSLRRVASLLALAACFDLCSARAADAQKEQGQVSGGQHEMAINHGPFLQAPSETEMTVSWATTRPALCWVEYRQEDSDRWLTNYPARHGLIEALGTYHNVPLTGLRPGATYVYRVVSREITEYKSWSVKFGRTVVSGEFRATSLDRAKPAFAFVVVSDRHEKIEPLRASWKTVDWTTVDLAFLNGDMVHAMNDLNQMFRTVIDPCVEHFAKNTPLIYVRGNHETRGLLARSLLDYFPTRSDRHYYTFSHGPVIFLVLDCGEDKADNDVEYFGLTAFRPYMEAQARWLEKEIQKPEFRKAHFRICLLHMPPANSTNPRFVQTGWLWEHVTPLLNKGKVDLLLSGHTHRDAVHPKGTDGAGYPLITTGPQTVLRADVTTSELRLSRSNLSGEKLPDVVIKRSLD